MKIQVECYSGHKADERPVKFWLGDVVLFVESVEDQWYGPDDAYFRVRADDGNTYVLGHNDVNESSFRMLVAAGFMPAFKYRQRNSLMMLERGRKARGYELTVHASLV